VPTGFEPATFRLTTGRATNCATAPCSFSLRALELRRTGTCRHPCRRRECIRDVVGSQGCYHRMAIGSLCRGKRGPYLASFSSLLLNPSGLNDKEARKARRYTESLRRSVAAILFYPHINLCTNPGPSCSPVINPCLACTLGSANAGCTAPSFSSGVANFLHRIRRSVRQRVVERRKAYPVGVEPTIIALTKRCYTTSASGT
jgi:hypothetical protein